MGVNEERALDVCTPPLTPTINAKFESRAFINNGPNGGNENVEYTLKPMTRAYASTARLNLQHYLWKDQTGYLLHPSIPLSGIENLKIADLGTGTGIWLLDLARTLPPSTQLDGFDIDISDCPHKQWLPQNVTMRYLNALAEVPEHLVGVYDIVQLRLFQVVVKDNDPGPLLRNVVKMLKPGGYLQWAEYDMTTQTTIKATPSLSSSALDAIPAFVQGFKKEDGRVGVQNWIPHLPLTFAQHSLTAIRSTRHATTSPFLPYQLDVFLLTYEELAAKTFDKLPGGHGDRLRELIEAASEEGRKGVGWGMDRLVVVGRKPELKALTSDESGGGDGHGHGAKDVEWPLPAATAGVLENESKIQSEDRSKAEVKAEPEAEPDTIMSDEGKGAKREGTVASEQNVAKKKRTSRRESLLRIWKRMSSS